MNQEKNSPASNPSDNQAGRPSNNPSDNQAGRQIKIADNIPGAEYANFMQINHNKEEIQIIFGNISGPSGRVVSKVITTPGHLKRMISAMQDNLSKYEEKFGKIEEAEIPENSIGFQERK